MESSNRRAIATTVLIVLAVVALAIAFLRPTSEITVSGPTPDFEQGVADAPIVIGLTESGGFKLLGIRFSSPTHRVRVGFEAPLECNDVTASATSWPTGDPRCGPPGVVSGEIAGQGISADQRALVIVEFEVTEECFDSVALGATWPQDSASC